MYINPHNLGSYNVPLDTKGGICLEIGANVGNFFSKHKNHFSLLHFYEAVEPLFDICQSKAEELDNIKGFNEAAYSCDGDVVTLVVHGNGDAGSCSILDESRERMSDWTQEKVSKTNTVSIETAIERLLSDSGAEEIDYMKIDCECGEYPFMLEKDLSKIKYIGMELHSQVGEEKFTELLNHIKKTHDIQGDATFYRNKNAEFLCVRRTSEK